MPDLMEGFEGSEGQEPITETDAQKIARLQRQLAEAKRGGRARAFSMKVSEKRALSLYIGGRFPVTLYAEQWQWLLEHKEEILKFIETNRERLDWR